ncbi:MAG: sigma-70 family RNA polymerase sigma factor [Firmicutes bacterium]|nr:sigma-70 family RNA polymerase sigma factor [Bacillota bacterium]
MQELDRIYQDNFIKVYRYVLSMSGDPHLAEDITQDTFFKAMQRLDSFRGDCSLTTWLCRIARNQYLNQANRKKHLQDITKQHPPESVSAEQESVQREQTAELLAAIQRLEEPYKEVLSLRMFSELPFREIGTIFGKNDSWARVIYHRARLKVKEELKDEY